MHLGPQMTQEPLLASFNDCIAISRHDAAHPRYQWLHRVHPQTKNGAKRSTTVDGGIIVIISPFFLFRTYLCTYLFLDVERESGTRFDCLGWVVFTCIHMGLHLHLSWLGCCSTLPVCACSWKGWSKRRSRLSTSQGFVQKTAGEINWSKHVKVASKTPRKVQCTGYHTVPYLTASLRVCRTVLGIDSKSDADCPLLPWFPRLGKCRIPTINMLNICTILYSSKFSKQNNTHTYYPHV